MNIFRLDDDPQICAQYHCDKHVLKMIIEYGQLLSTAHRLCDGIESRGSSKSGKSEVRVWKLSNGLEDTLYKASHVNHPSNVWVRSHKENYVWLCKLWIYLCEQYGLRYKKTHMTYIKLGDALCGNIPKNIDKGINLSKFPQCMPEECKREDAITAYRSFYRAHKREFATWKNGIPEWFN